MKWHECTECGAEFRIVADTHIHPEFCPFCATELPVEDDEDDEDEDDDY